MVVFGKGRRGWDRLWDGQKEMGIILRREGGKGKVVEWEGGKVNDYGRGSKGGNDWEGKEGNDCGKGKRGMTL